MGVAVGRRPEVFVRPVSLEEGRRLQRISRTAKDPVRLRRAIVVMISAKGRSVPDITSLLQVSADYVRDVIHAFNERGFDALDPKWSGGRPRTISSRVREHICLIARTSPADWGLTGPPRRPASGPAACSGPAGRSRPVACRARAPAGWQGVAPPRERPPLLGTGSGRHVRARPCLEQAAAATAPKVFTRSQARVQLTLSVYVEPLMVAVTATVFCPGFSVMPAHLKMWSPLLRVPREVPLRVAVTWSALE